MRGLRSRRRASTRRINVRLSIALAFFAVTALGAVKGDPIPSACKELLRDHPNGDIPALQARWVAATLDMERVRKHLRVLSGEAPVLLKYRIGDRHSDAHREWTRFYIISQMNRLGWRVETDDFGSGINLYVEIPGTESPGEVFEVSAHYDTAGMNVPGADDNGSGLGLLFEFARIFKAHPPKKTLRIAFMDLEERGFVGSRAHAQKLAEDFVLPGADNPDGKRIFLGALVLDTIGWNPPASDPAGRRVVLEVGEDRHFVGARSGTPSPVSLWTLAPRRSESVDLSPPYAVTLRCAERACFQFLRFADAAGTRDGIRLTVEKETAKAGTADHGSYWAAGFPAMLLAAPFDRPYVNPHYHQPSDTLANVTWDYYSAVSRFAVEILAGAVHAAPRLTNRIVDQERVFASMVDENTDVARDQDFIGRLRSEPKRKHAPVTASVSPPAADARRARVVLHVVAAGQNFGEGVLLSLDPTQPHTRYEYVSDIPGFFDAPTQVYKLTVRHPGTGAFGSRLSELAAWIAPHASALVAAERGQGSVADREAAMKAVEDRVRRELPIGLTLAGASYKARINEVEQ